MDKPSDNCIIHRSVINATKNIKKCHLRLDNDILAVYHLSILKDTLNEEGIIININDLKAEITRNELTIEKLAEELKISRSSMIRKINGITKFTQPEMVKLQNALKLSGEKMIQIFFSDKVS